MKVKGGNDEQCLKALKAYLEAVDENDPGEEEDVTRAKSRVAGIKDASEC